MLIISALQPSGRSSRVNESPSSGADSAHETLSNSPSVSSLDDPLYSPDICPESELSKHTLSVCQHKLFLLLHYKPVMHAYNHSLCKDLSSNFAADSEEAIMDLGEMSSSKKVAIMTTLQRHTAWLCEGVSITCLVAILYSNNVTGSPVFTGLGHAPHKSEYLVQEILAAVEKDPAKFEAVCSSISLAHSPACGRLLWSEQDCVSVMI